MSRNDLTHCSRDSPLTLHVRKVFERPFIPAKDIQAELYWPTGLSVPQSVGPSTILTKSEKKIHRGDKKVCRGSAPRWLSDDDYSIGVLELWRVGSIKSSEPSCLFRPHQAFRLYSTPCRVE